MVVNIIVCVKKKKVGEKKKDPGEASEKKGVQRQRPLAYLPSHLTAI